MVETVSVLYGPTASGKSAAALEMARQRECVIINADAMQCYDALHILTAQPSAQEQAEAPHRLYGFVPAACDMTVTLWCEKAVQEIKSAFEKGAHPVLVGGTGFYLKTLMEGLSPIPDIPHEVRDQAISMFEQEGLAPLLGDLKTYGDEALQGIDLHNSRRVIRAWEVLKHTGRPLQEWQKTPKQPYLEDIQYDLRLITRERAVLIERINVRFDQMLESGILDEVRALTDRVEAGEVPEDNLILKAQGFKPLRAYLKGEMTLEKACEITKTQTRQYAKRQMTWARHQFGLV